MPEKEVDRPSRRSEGSDEVSGKRGCLSSSCDSLHADKVGKDVCGSHESYHADLELAPLCRSETVLLCGQGASATDPDNYCTEVGEAAHSLSLRDVVVTLPTEMFRPRHVRPGRQVDSLKPKPVAA